MGKNLKGKECGKGIYQRKDGLYHARFVDKAGKRHEKYFQTIPEARNWIEQAKYADKHEDVFCPSDTTVDAWFSFWIENIVGDLAPNTLRNYRERYKQNIQPIIGKMLLSDVKPMHCKKVLLSMDADYAGSTIRQTYITMGTLFKAAKMNDIAEYLEDMADRERQTEVGTVAELLDEIESENLYQVLVAVDGRTLKIVLLKMQGYSTKEIAPLVHLTTGAIYARLDHLRKKLRKFYSVRRSYRAA